LTRMQPVQHGKITFARNAKGVRHALSNQTVNDKVAAKFMAC
jgi:hypothetical protein